MTMERRTDTVSPQDLVLEFLRDPRSYSHPTDDFQVHETHISWVFLVGPHAYKLKKAVSLGFLDYSTPELRRKYCGEELRLNRRLAPSIYLDVLAVRSADERLFFASEEEVSGRALDYVVRMRRLSDEATLRSLLGEKAARPAHIDRLLRLLVPFYEGAPRAADPVGLGSPQALRASIVGNLKQTKPFVGELLDEARFRAIRSGQLSFLTLREKLFQARLEKGYVRDVHGDLRAEHVVYTPECAVMDGIEFNDAFRIIDVVADLAFLAMDLEFLGAPRLADLLIERYAEDSGDVGAREVLDFYISNRACIRGMVDAIKLHQPGVDTREKERLRKRGRRFFELAHFHTVQFHRPLLVAVGGLSGTGKSTVAHHLATTLGAPLLRSDVIRKELAGLSPTAARQDSFGTGIYTEVHTRRTYAALAGRAGRLLHDSSTVVVDATFSRETDRQNLHDVARECGARFVQLECRVPESVAKERLRRRAEDEQDASDAGVAIQGPQAALYEEPRAGEALRLDTAGPVEDVVGAALALLREKLAANAGSE